MRFAAFLLAALPAAAALAIAPNDIGRDLVDRSEDSPDAPGPPGPVPTSKTTPIPAPSPPHPVPTTTSLTTTTPKRPTTTPKGPPTTSRKSTTTPNLSTPQTTPNKPTTTPKRPTSSSSSHRTTTTPVLSTPSTTPHKPTTTTTPKRPTTTPKSPTTTPKKPTTTPKRPTTTTTPKQPTHTTTKHTTTKHRTTTHKHTPTPTPTGGVSIKSINYAGSGCGSGSVSGSLSQNSEELTLEYSSFVAVTGSGIQPSEGRKNCQVNLELEVPKNWQFSLLQAEYSGFAFLEDGATGVIGATYYFSGESNQVVTNSTIKGPYIDNYVKIDEIGLKKPLWSSCGKEALFNIDSEVSVSPLASSSFGFLSGDTSSLKFSQVQYLEWRQC
ncbi:hypothetical protein BX600DRAFT_513625 [Xylariales sp. PMI_506]|nr:hypothetical protein BX600DRAFT_513625 [Xylariales sp. PMI_506]